jgi:hypothetical protein
LLGAVIAEYLKDAGDSSLAKTVFELVGRKLTRPADRALFPNLPAMPAADTTSKTLSHAAKETAQAGG